MKRMNLRSFISGVLVSLLVVGLIGTAAATVGRQSIDVDYKNMVVQLDYKPLDLTDANGRTVEAFAYNGTTYVPVRAIASALGYNVSYIETNGTGNVYLESPIPSFSALSSDYPFTGVPRLDNVVGQNAFYMSFPAEEGNTDRTFYQYYKPYFNEGTQDSFVSLYESALKDRGFHLFQTSTVEGYPMYHYVNDDTMVFVSLFTSKLNDQEYVAVLVNTEQQKKSSSPAPSSPSNPPSSSSGSGTVAPAPSTSPANNDSPKFDGNCPICGIACSREYLNDTYEVWKCRNPNCTHYNQIVYP